MVRIVYKLVKGLVSTSHAVGLEQKKLYTFVSLFLNFLMSPSHTVGLEHLAHVKSGFRGDRVSIPRGGLRTEIVAFAWRKYLKLPSHTVGLEGGEPSAVKSRPLGSSPSHPVGLKHLPKILKIQALTLSKFKQPTERTH